MRTALLTLLLSPALFACAEIEASTRPTKSTAMGAPVVLTADAANNPDVIWVVRELRYPQTSVPQFGLFACYRGPATAPSAQCILASTVGKREEILFPAPLPAAAPKAEATESEE